MSKKRKFCAESSTLLNKKSHWSLGLLDAMKDPELLVKTDDKIVIIKDKYPKAKFHYLVLPKDEISNLKELSRKHVELLQYMEAAAEALIKNKVNLYKNIRFKFGYHAEASMHRLHMHLISDDMCSDCLKTKRHWNSFTTDFFINSHDIREDLEKNGKLTILPSAEKIKDFLNKPLACHKCEEKPKNIPALKKHILTHVKI